MTPSDDYDMNNSNNNNYYYFLQDRIQYPVDTVIGQVQSQAINSNNDSSTISEMLTEEEKEAERNGWREEAAACDLLLEEIDPDDKDEIKEVFAVLKVSSITAKSRLRVFIQNVRAQRDSDKATTLISKIPYMVKTKLGFDGKVSVPGGGLEETSDSKGKRKDSSSDDAAVDFDNRNRKRARTKFWRATREPLILQAPEKKICWYQGSANSKLFVRECTIKFFDQIWQAVQNRTLPAWQKGRPRFAVFIITGPPGLGKSWSANYFLWSLLQKRQNVWFHSASELKYTTIEFEKGETNPKVHVEKEDDIRSLSRRLYEAVPEGTWLLYDAAEGETGNPLDMVPFRKQKQAVPCVIFSSPRYKNYYKTGLKEMTGGIKQFFWTPAWEWPEIKCVMRALYDEWGDEKHSFEDFNDFIKSLFDLWGGIPRRFNEYTRHFRESGKHQALQASKKDFGDEMSLLAPALLKNGYWIDRDITLLDVPGTKAENDSSSTKVNPPSWLLFPSPLESEREGFEKKVYRFCSQKAELEFFKNLEKQKTDEVLAFCREVFIKTKSSAANGIAFERFARFVLTRKQDNSFRWRKYSDDSKSRFALPKCKELSKCEMNNSLEEFQAAVRKCIKDNKRGVIESKSEHQDAIDMFVVTKLEGHWHVLAIQDTISKTHSFHPIKILEYRAAAEKALQQAIPQKEKPQEDFFRHVVVVPDEKRSESSFSLLPAKHNNKNYWCPPEHQTRTSTTNTEDAEYDLVISKYNELGLSDDPGSFNNWTAEAATSACIKGEVEGFRNCPNIKAVVAGAKLLTDAEEEVKKWTWVLDGFFE